MKARKKRRGGVSRGLQSRLTVILLCLVLILSCFVSGCGTRSSGTPENKAQTASSPSTPTPSPTPEAAPTEEAPTEAPPAEVVKASYTLSYSTESAFYTGFSEGLCWIYAGKDMNFVPTVIDETGRIVYRMTDMSYTSKGVAAATPFRNGFSVFYPVNNQNGEHKEGFLVIDAEGNELFSSEDKFLGRWGDTIIAQRHVASFSENGYYLVGLDRFGNEVKPPLKHESLFGYSEDVKAFTDLSAGLFARGGELFQADRWEYYPILNSSAKILYPVTDGYAMVHISDSHNEKIPISAEVLSDPAALADFFAQDYFYTKGRVLSFGGGMLSIENKDAYYYDCSGNKAITLSYPDGVQIRAKTGFQNGYAAVYLKGADGKNYMTVIDLQGQQQYEPIQISEFAFYDSYSSQSFVQYNGYVPVKMDGQKGFSIITPDGRILVPGRDDLSEIGADAVILDREGSPVLSGGFFSGHYLDRAALGLSAGETAFVSLDGATVISAALEYGA